MVAANVTPRMKLNVLENAVLISLRFENYGNRGTVDARKVQTTADKKSLHVTKMLLNSPEYRALMNHRARWRDWLQERSAPSALGGTATYALPLALLAEVEEGNQRREQQDAALLDALVAAYPVQVQEARARLREEFDVRNYPDASNLRREFAVHLSYISIGTPDALKKVSRALHAREVGKFYAALEETAAKIDGALTGELAEIIDWMVERVTDADDGKAKQFGKPFDQRMGKIQDFFRLLKHRNLTGNDKLDELAEQAKALLDGVSAEKLKSSTDFRKHLHDSLAPIKATLDELVVTKPTRRIVLEE